MAFARDDLEGAVSRALRRLGEGLPLPPTEEVESAAGILAGHAPALLGEPSLPGPGETAAVADVASLMTAALCHDRVLDYTRLVPEGIAFAGCTRYDLELWATALGMILLAKSPSGPRTSAQRVQRAASLMRMDAMKLLSPELGPEVPDQPWDIRAGARPDMTVVLRARAEALREERGCSAVPVYVSQAARDREYAEGDHGVVACALSGLRVVDEDALTWDKVLNFREDGKARDRYRSLIHWLDGGMVGKSHAYIEREIAERLKAYESALEDHKIKTKLGVLEGLLDGKFVLGGTAATVAAGALAGPFGALAAGGVMLLGRTAATVARHNLDEKAVHGDHKEIAWVYEVKKKLGE